MTVTGRHHKLRFDADIATYMPNNIIYTYFIEVTLNDTYVPERNYMNYQFASEL